MPNGPFLKNPGPLRISLYDKSEAAPLQQEAEKRAIEANPEHQALLSSTKNVIPRPRRPVGTPVFASDEDFAKVQREAATLADTTPLGSTVPYRPGFRAAETLMTPPSEQRSGSVMLTSVRSNVTNSNDVRKKWREAIASIESQGSGDYEAVGPIDKKLGRALGRYQVMEANIGPWSKAALGRELTPEAFLADPKAQDVVFDHIFGQYVEQFGSTEKAAQAWFAGAGGVGTNRRDVLGTSVSEYSKKFMEAFE